MNNQDFALAGDLGLGDQIRQWAEAHPADKYPYTIEIALKHLAGFIRLGSIPSAVNPDLFKEIVCSKDPKRAANIAFDILLQIHEERGSSIEDGYVIYTLCDPSAGVKPKPYIESMIRTIAIALSERDTLGFAAQLGTIHPELCAAVDRFLSGKISPGNCKKE